MHLLSNHSKNLRKHHFLASFTYIQTFRKFEILTQFPRGLFMVFGQKSLKTLCMHLLSNHTKTLHKHHFSASFNYTETLR